MTDSLLLAIIRRANFTESNFHAGVAEWLGAYRSPAIAQCSDGTKLFSVMSAA
jgi:hypothetical protein